MSGTVQTDLQFFSGATGGDTSCDSETDWTGHYSLDTELKIQGTGALTVKASKATVIAEFSISGTVDLSEKLIYFWAFFADPIGRLGNKSQGGLGFKVQDQNGVSGQWYLAGKDTWDGGWKAFAQYTGAPFDEETGSVDMSAISTIGIRFTTVETSKVTPNCYFDAIRYGTYLRIVGGSESDPATFDDLITAENNSSNKYGVLEREGGILFAQGNLEFGSPSTWSTYFKDIDEVLVFRELPNTLPTDWYEIRLNGNTVDFTSIFFGDKVGQTGVAGCIFRAEGAPKYRVEASDPNINTFGIYGSSFLDPNTVTFQSFSPSRENLNTSFSGGAIIKAEETVFKNCAFLSADDTAVTIDDTNFKITYSDFINNPKAIEITQPGTYSFDNLTFTGNSIDVVNTTGQTIEVQLLSSDPSTQSNPNGGTINFVSALPLKVYVTDEAGDPLSGIRVAIFTDPDLTQLMNELTDVNGLAEETYTGTTPQAVSIRARKEGYIPVYQPAEIGTDGLTTYITLYDDPSYNPT